MKMYSLTWASLLLATLALANTKDHCPKLKPAVGLKIPEIFGTWYAVRGIEHGSQNSNSSAKQTKSCPIIKLILKDNIIEFQWHSKDKPLKKIELTPSMDKLGLLLPVNKKGNAKSSLQITLTDDTKNIIGVTMCKSGGKTASVILSRNPTFVKEEIQSVTTILGSQGLDVNNVFDRCL